MNLGEEIRKLEKYGMRPKGFPSQPRSYNKFSIHRKSDQKQVGLVLAFDSESALAHFFKTSLFADNDNLIAVLVMEEDYVSVTLPFECN